MSPFDPHYRLCPADEQTATIPIRLEAESTITRLVSQLTLNLSFRLTDAYTEWLVISPDAVYTPPYEGHSPPPSTSSDIENIPNTNTATTASTGTNLEYVIQPHVEIALSSPISNFRHSTQKFYNKLLKESLQAEDWSLPVSERVSAHRNALPYGMRGSSPRVALRWLEAAATEKVETILRETLPPEGILLEGIRFVTTE